MDREKLQVWLKELICWWTSLNTLCSPEENHLHIRWVRMISMMTCIKVPWSLPCSLMACWRALRTVAWVPEVSYSFTERSRAFLEVTSPPFCNRKKEYSKTIIHPLNCLGSEYEREIFLSAHQLHEWLTYALGKPWKKDTWKVMH